MRRRNLKVLVVDDHALMREAVRAVLAGADGVEAVGEAETGREALRRAAELQPDVVLLDLRLPDVDGLECLDALRAAHPDAHVVVFTAVEDEELVTSALARGAAGYVLKRIDPLDVPAAIRQIVDRTVFPAGPTPYERPRAGLSNKELAVLEQLALGLSNRDIASALWISDQTVKFHLRNIYRKLGAANRTDAIRIAHERGVVSARA